MPLKIPYSTKLWQEKLGKFVISTFWQENFSECLTLVSLAGEKLWQI